MINKIWDELPETWSEDTERIAMFPLALAQRFAELVDQGLIHDAELMMGEAAIIVGSYAHKARRLSFADLFRDPFKGHREKVRQFAIKWSLPSSFMEHIV